MTREELERLMIESLEHPRVVGTERFPGKVGFRVSDTDGSEGFVTLLNREGQPDVPR